MNRSDQIGELIAALAKAQSEFGSAIKESVNPAFRSKYADLAANIGAVRPALNKNGIALMQFDEADLEHQTASVTTALHHGEQFISITAEAPATGRNGFDVQSIGSCWTYLRRYTLQAICGLASEDDDGEALAGADNKPIQRKTPAEVHPEPRPISDGRKQEAVPGPERADDLVKAFIKGCKENETKEKKQRFLTVTWRGFLDGFTYASCFHASLFDALRDATGYEAELRIREKKSDDGRSIQFFYIEDVISVNGIQYKDGKPNELMTQLVGSLKEKV